MEAFCVHFYRSQMLKNFELSLSSLSLIFRKLGFFPDRSFQKLQFLMVYSFIKGEYFFMGFNIPLFRRSESNILFHTILFHLHTEAFFVIPILF